MCDLSDPRIVEAYTEITEYEETDWLVLGYNDTRDVISLYAKGTRGLSEFRQHLSDEVLYGFVRVDDRFILITWVSEHVSGVRRARALVHSRSVASLLKAQHAQITASSVNDVSDASIRARLKLGENQVPNRSRPTSMSERKRNSLSAKRQSRSEDTPTSPTSPSSPAPPTPTPPTPTPIETNNTNDDTVTAEPDSFADASEELPPSPQQEQESEEERLRKKQEEEKQTALAAAAARERARAAAEEEERKKRAEQEAEARAEAEAKAEQARKDEEERQKQVAAEKELERQRRAEAEKQQQEEKKRMQKQMAEAEKNKDVMLLGFASVQPGGSPFWRRRYFVIRGKNMIFYRDELDVNPIFVIDLKSVTRLSALDPERETFLPNAFALDTQKDGSYQFFADDKQSCNTILTALQTVMQA
ncbi:hypothetical protein BCR43DRAFT_490239 [Syncephalastrum racemosum]|uniref:ADF-H domain-containing protein n=1 Tax=Syncephalastrum racemosum TaxID=13706 RepID=A0A1X2HFI1_SYNRA|nr:hypothetical protein BCR43DRAFT_490239 [Syncephalastrum racemosum]